MPDSAGEMTATVSGEVTLSPHPVAGGEAIPPPAQPPPLTTMEDLRAELERQRIVVAGMEEAHLILATTIQQLKRQQRQADGRMDAYAPALERMEAAYQRLEGEMALLKASLTAIDGRLAALAAYMPYLEDLKQQGEERRLQDARLHDFLRSLKQRLNWAIGLGASIAATWAMSNLGSLLNAFTPGANAHGALFLVPVMLLVLSVALVVSVLSGNRANGSGGGGEGGTHGGA